MNRRELLKVVTLATGSALAIPLTGSILTACSKVEKIDETDFNPAFFDQEEFGFLRKLLDAILPKTDSPSALDVGVDQIIDTIVAEVYSDQGRKDFRSKFEMVREAIGETDPAKALQQILKEGEQETKDAFSALKQQAIAYYLSTEEISKNYLNFLPVPGAYEPCISLESVGGKSWAI